MSTSVTDESAFADRKIRIAARVIGKSPQRLAVFKAIYFGKTKVKTLDHIRQVARLKTKKRVLEEGKKLATGRIIEQTKLNGETAYKKIDFYYQNQKAVISLVKRNVEGRIKLLSNPITGTIEVHIKVDRPSAHAKAKRITINDIDSFAKAKRVSRSIQRRYPEEVIKKRLQKIVDERGKFQDWGGETNDVYTDRVVFRGKRVATALALKGKGTTPPLTPRKMGQNGDQITRLFRSAAQIFLIVFDGQIDQSIVEQMESFAENKASAKKKPIYYGIIDGADLARLFAAYSDRR